jgi:hypothetical protein
MGTYVPVAHPAYLREKARKLRREKKLTIDELAERLALPRTTIYYWVRDIPIDRKPHTTWPESARRKGSAAMQRKYRLLREAAYDEAVEEFLFLDAQETFRDFICMYIGEGYKRSRNMVSLVNSDPAVVRLARYWIDRLSDRVVWYRLSYHADQDPVALREFWSSELQIEPEVIGVKRKSNSGQLARRVWRSEHGLLTVGANDTYLRARLQAWMDWLEDGWSELDSTPVGA